MPTLNNQDDIEELVKSIHSNAIDAFIRPETLTHEKFDYFTRNCLARAKQAGIQECIDLSDKIELQEADGGTKQWMAFKAFRNAMRDRIKKIKEN